MEDFLKGVNEFKEQFKKLSMEDFIKKFLGLFLLFLVLSSRNLDKIFIEIYEGVSGRFF